MVAGPVNPPFAFNVAANAVASTGAVPPELRMTSRSSPSPSVMRLLGTSVGVRTGS